MVACKSIYDWSWLSKVLGACMPSGKEKRERLGEGMMEHWAFVPNMMGESRSKILSKRKFS